MSHCTNFHRRCGGVSSVAMLARMCGFSCCHAVAILQGVEGDVMMCVADVYCVGLPKAIQYPNCFV